MSSSPQERPAIRRSFTRTDSRQIDEQICFSDDMHELPTCVPTCMRRVSMEDGEGALRRSSTTSEQSGNVIGRRTSSELSVGRRISSEVLFFGSRKSSAVVAPCSPPHDRPGSPSVAPPSPDGLDDDAPSLGQSLYSSDSESRADSVAKALENGTIKPVRRRLSITQDGKDLLAQTEAEERGHEVEQSVAEAACYTWALHPQSAVRFYWDCLMLCRACGPPTLGLPRAASSTDLAPDHSPAL